MKKLKVGVLGATGMVGQRYIALLEHHPWFEVTYLAASPRSAGKKYFEAVSGRWQMTTPIPNNVKNIEVKDANCVEDALGKIDFVFSAVELDKELTRELEMKYARNNIPVVSNCSAHRGTEDVPMLIPEINHSHLDIIPIQQENRGFTKGFVIVKPNCSVQSYITPMFALEQKGYKISRAIISTMQATSGAGHPGVASLDLLDNIIPYIGGEEEKSEVEPQKILGSVENGKIIKDTRHEPKIPS